MNQEPHRQERDRLMEAAFAARRCPLRCPTNPGGMRDLDRARDIAARVLAGETYASIAAPLGLTPERVRQIAKRMGVVSTYLSRRREKRQTAREARAAHLLARAILVAALRSAVEGDGLSIEAAARKLGIGRGAAYFIFKKHGIRSRHQSGNPKYRRGGD